MVEPGPAARGGALCGKLGVASGLVSAGADGGCQSPVGLSRSFGGGLWGKDTGKPRLDEAMTRAATTPRTGRAIRTPGSDCQRFSADSQARSCMDWGKWTALLCV